MSEAYDSLSGDWSGVFDYPDNQLEATPFNAVLVQNGSGFSGQITEPKIDILDGKVTFNGEVFADIDGDISGASVEFIKVYDPLASEFLGQVHYLGVVNASFSKIEGRWTTMDEDSWSGPFVMNRIQAAAKKGVQELCEEIGIYRGT